MRAENMVEVRCAKCGSTENVAQPMLFGRPLAPECGDCFADWFRSLIRPSKERALKDAKGGDND